ncbi:hypothetical protein CEN40_01345, partial [Fischerella thermalis CCMEE 5205]
SFKIENIDTEKKALSMRFIDILLLTLISTVICLVLPKVLYTVLARKNKPTASSPRVTRTQDIHTEVVISF